MSKRTGRITTIYNSQLFSKKTFAPFPPHLSPFFCVTHASITFVCLVGEFLRILPWHIIHHATTIWGIFLVFSNHPTSKSKINKSNSNVTWFDALKTGSMARRLPPPFVGPNLRGQKSPAAGECQKAAHKERSPLVEFDVFGKFGTHLWRDES